MSNKWDHDELIQRLRDYLRIPSVHPNINYNDCVTFLKKQASQLDLPVAVYEFVPTKPVVVITWEGSNPSLPSILLNSHMDVVPVYEDKWTYPPFEACITEDGFIYARGSQDMKSVGMAHLEAIRRLKNSGICLRRTVHLSFVPDEEIGGRDGMKIFSESEEFKKLNIGFELDESGPSGCSRELLVFNGERTCIQIKVTCSGVPGHACFLLNNTAGDKLNYIMNKFMKLRAEEKNKIDKKGIWLGDVTSINLTQIEGGVLINVLPESLSASFDIRLAPDVDYDEFINMIESWCKEAGDRVTIEYISKNPQVANTKIEGNVPLWDALKKSVNDMGYTLKCVICPGTTDARYIRQQGIPAINFTPFIDTPPLLHCDDERIHVDVYKKGIDIIEKVVEAVGNV